MKPNRLSNDWSEKKNISNKPLKLKSLFFIFLFSYSLAWSNSFSQTVTMNIKNGILTNVLTELKSQTGYNIIYSDNLISKSKPINIDAKNMPLSVFLEKILASNNLTYVLSEKNILIKKANESQKISDNLRSKKSTEENQSKISGKIKNEQGMPLGNVNVLNKSTSAVSSSNQAGVFEIQAKVNDVLVFTFMGYKMQSIPIQNMSDLFVELISSENQINEVVVTALGIKRDEKAIGYAQQTINSEQLATAASPNWSDGLKGKVAGLNIVSGSTGPINSQQIQLRGGTSLDPSSNHALIVIDGVPMDQETTPYIDNVGAAYGNEAPVDYGNSISELRQEDIESVSVLKGPSAAALYGSRAANGVVIITTKSGKKNQKLGISYNSSLNLDQVSNWPNYQYEYGAGNMTAKDANGNPYYSWGDSMDGQSTNNPTAFGPKFDGQYFYQYDPITQEQGKERTLWQPYKNNMKDLFRLGTTFENAVSIQGGDTKGSMRLNIAHTNNAYIAPNTGYQRNAVSFNGNYQVSERIKASASVNYNNRSSDNLPAFGMSNGSLGYFLMFLPPSVNTDWYKPIWQKGKENLEQINPFSQWSSNPYFILNVDKNPLTSNQIIGNTKVDVKLTDHWDLMGRLSMNSLSQIRETERGYSSKKHLKGYYGRQDVASQEVNMDFLTTYKNTFSENFDYSIMAGGSQMDYDMRNVLSSVDALIVPNMYMLSNGVNNPITKSLDSKKRISSLYGMGSISWKDKIFLDATARNDWSSTLPLKNNSYFYPSVNTSFILSDLLDIPDVISYLKYRASYAIVGADADPYQISRYYSQSSFPSSAIFPSTMFNADLKPEITSSFETGIDLKFFKNKLGFDLTYYNSTTKNQILVLPMDIVGGYSSRVINAGEVLNRGWELMINANPIKHENLDWQIIGNFSTNHNEILTLTDNLEQQTLATVWQSYLIGTVGGSTTDLWGTKFKRDPEGNIIYNKGIATWESMPQYIGNTAPDFKFGLTNTFLYKSFRLSFTFDGQVGGKIFSGTYNRASWDGFTKNTLPGREEGFIIGDGVIANEDGSYSKNDIKVNPQTYYGQYHQVTEAGVFSGTFLKFRELTFGYNFPKSMLKPLRIEGLSLNVFGRNLLIIDKYPMFDPEGGTKNGAVFVPGIELAPMPHTSSYGFNLKVDF